MSIHLLVGTPQIKHEPYEFECSDGKVIEKLELNTSVIMNQENFDELPECNKDNIFIGNNSFINTALNNAKLYWFKEVCTMLAHDSKYSCEDMVRLNWDMVKEFENVYNEYKNSNPDSIEPSKADMLRIIEPENKIYRFFLRLLSLAI